MLYIICFFFFFNDTATTEIYTLSLHDALPILLVGVAVLLIFTIEAVEQYVEGAWPQLRHAAPAFRSQAIGRSLWASVDRKSTRLNSSHANISYAVFCLKKKKYTNEIQ